MERKPAGIIILAVLSFLGFVFFLVGVFFSQATFSTVRSLTANRIYLDNVGASAVIINLAFAGYHLSIGIGLIMLKNWARILYLVNTWIATILFGLSGLIFIVLTFVAGPGALLLFFIVSIGLTINIFILRYLYKPEIANLFALSSYNKSDSYSIPSQFGEVDPADGNINDDDFADPTISHIKVPGTLRKTESAAQTQLMESQPSVMAMLFKDMGNGKYKHFDIDKNRISIKNWKIFTANFFCI